MEKTIMNCCFTGHRDIPVGVQASVRERVTHEVRKLAALGVVSFMSGGALGFDLLAAQAVLDIKEELPHIMLIAALPCRDQDKYWTPRDKERYHAIISRADEVVYVSEHYTNGCMLKRNRYMVEHCDYCLAYLARNTGGTAYTVNYALKRGLKVANIHV